jgi:adenylate cyclase
LALRAALRAILHKPTEGRKFIVIASIAFTVFTAALYLYQPAFIRFLNSKFYDVLAQSVPQDAVETSLGPVIVDLDEKSLARYGQWPWPRYRVALLLEKLHHMGVSAIGLDILLAEQDRTSFAVLRKDIYRDLKMDVPLNGIPDVLMDHDRTLANVLSRVTVILGYRFTFAAENSPPAGCLLHPLNLAILKDKDTPDADRFLFHSQGVICNLPIFMQNAISSGFINTIPDEDGVLRRTPLIIKYKENYYPSLALATLAQALRVKQTLLKTNSKGVESLYLDKMAIPLDSGGNLLIRYRGKGKTGDYISASDLLNGDVSKERLQGKIVLVGSSATGLADIHTTTTDIVFPGMEIHATVIDNLLKKDFFSRPNWVPGLELLLVIIAGLFSTVLLTWTGAVWSLVILGFGALGLWQFSYWTLHSNGIFFSSIMPLIALISHYSFITILKYWREERKAKARSKKLIFTQEFTIRCLASLTETRDSETGGHILRTQRYVSSLCRQLATHPNFCHILDSETIDHFFKSSPLHDIGKVGVPDHILLKPGKLTVEEFEQMKKHTTYGRDAIQRAEDNFGSHANSDFLNLAKEIAYTHHEKWDGTGYPEKLKGENIPLPGRIMALADVYDAMICQRVYKPPVTHEEATALIVQLKGILFDPDVVDAFIAIKEEFRQISIELADREEHTDTVPTSLKSGEAYH